MYFKPDVLMEQVHSHKWNWRSPKGTACVKGLNLGANSNLTFPPTVLVFFLLFESKLLPLLSGVLLMKHLDKKPSFAIFILYTIEIKFLPLKFKD